MLPALSLSWHWGQVPRILNPVALVLDALPALCRDAQLASYVQAVFGSVEGCRCAHSRGPCALSMVHA